jgi:NADH-quinone oxidoreductase subunit L
VIAVGGWFLAHYFYQLKPDQPDRWAAKLRGAYALLLNKYWVDELYDKTVVEPVKRWGRRCDAVDTGVVDGAVVGVRRLNEASAAASTWVEKYVIYGGLNVTGFANHLAARVLRRLQTGLVHHYATILVAGFVLLVNLIVLLLWVGGGS